MDAGPVADSKVDERKADSSVEECPNARRSPELGEKPASISRPSSICTDPQPNPVIMNRLLPAVPV